MEFSFYIENLEPLSINNSHYGQKSGYAKKPKTRKWEKQLQHGLLAYRDKINEIKSTFIPDQHILTRQYIFFFPRKKFYTAKGELSIFTKDVSNVSKIPDDILANLVFKIDDKFIQRGLVEKLPWDRSDCGCLIIVNLEEQESLESRTDKWIEYMSAC